ncbi:MAG: type II toxin-antitoxin system Phd/YefM family antitoxin [Protaetiibacter sp.]
MKVDTRDIRAASQVARNFGQITDEVEAGRTIVVVRNNIPVGVLAPVSLVDRLDAVDEREEDLRLLGIALVRMNTSTSELVELDDLAAELGVELRDDDPASAGPDAA